MFILLGRAVNEFVGTTRHRYLPGGRLNARSPTPYLTPSCASDEDSSRWALAWASNSRAFFSRASTASAPAGQRSGGSAWLASWTSALASLAGSPPCKPLIFFHAATVCLVVSA